LGGDPKTFAYLKPKPPGLIHDSATLVTLDYAIAQSNDSAGMQGDILLVGHQNNGLPGRVQLIE